MRTPSLPTPAAARGLVGRTGVVVARTAPDRTGEVRLVDRGLPLTVLASADRELAAGSHVLVVLDRGRGHVDVVAWSAPAEDVR